jgi:fucose permease
VSQPRLERDDVTRAAYLMLGLWAFLLYAIGPALPDLREQLDVSRAAVSLHTTVIACGAILIGVVGDRVVRRLGRRRAFWSAATGIALGAVVLASGGRLPLTLLGSFVLGVSGALQVSLIQSTLADRHGSLAAAAQLESNALAAALGAVAPFVIGLAILAGGDWRFVFVAAALFVAPAIALSYRGVEFPQAPELHHEQPRALPLGYWLPWTALLLFVAVEFCIAFWATDYLETERGFRESAAAASASLLLVGMTVGRFGGGWVARRAHPEPILLTALATAAVGFALFWLVDIPAAALAGLAIAGVGIALLYPLTLTLAIDAAEGRTDAATARAAFASGIAIAVAPFVLGAFADAVGLVGAFAVVPVLMAAGLGALVLARGLGRA